jgi:hypothetical protein
VVEKQLVAQPRKMELRSIELSSEQQLYALLELLSLTMLLNHPMTESVAKEP